MFILDIFVYFIIVGIIYNFFEHDDNGIAMIISLLWPIWLGALIFIFFVLFFYWFIFFIVHRRKY